jgi:hypothetical protein
LRSLKIACSVWACSDSRRMTLNVTGGASPTGIHFQWLLTLLEPKRSIGRLPLP